MYLWFKYVSDGFYGISSDVKTNINRICYNGNGSLVAHEGVAILREIVCLLSPGCFYFKNPLLEGDMIPIFLLVACFMFLCFLNESMLSRASSAFSCGNPCKENHVV